MPTDKIETPLVEGVDYTIDEGRWVFTSAYLKRRGYCCGNGCRHCPYANEAEQTPAADSGPRDSNPPE